MIIILALRHHRSRDFFLACGNVGVANCTIDLIPRGAFIVKRSDALDSIRLSAC
jgi:hypothetical protein